MTPATSPTPAAGRTRAASSPPSPPSSAPHPAATEPVTRGAPSLDHGLSSGRPTPPGLRQAVERLGVGRNRKQACQFAPVEATLALPAHQEDPPWLCLAPTPAH